LVPGQAAAFEQTIAAALTANDEALLADYVRRHAVQGDRAGQTRSRRRRRHSGRARKPIRRKDQ
jgi:hypothetical protein